MTYTSAVHIHRDSCCTPPPASNTPTNRTPTYALSVRSNNNSRRIQVYEKNITEDIEFISNVYRNLQHQIIDVSGFAQISLKAERINMLFEQLLKYVNGDDQVYRELAGRIKENKEAVEVLTSVQLSEESTRPAHLSEESIRQIGSFFIKPEKLSYIDPKNKNLYFKPDHSELWKIAHDYCANDYHEIGVLVSRMSGTSEIFRRIHPVKGEENCDIVYFVKSADQIEHERRIALEKKGKLKRRHYEDDEYHRQRNWSIKEIFNAFMRSFVTASNLEPRMKEQAENLESIKNHFKSKLKEWNYSDVFLLTSPRKLREFGFSGEDLAAKTQHAFVLFHKRQYETSKPGSPKLDKPLPISPSRVEVLES